ncbi:MAG TPA: sulfite exporter TauE/SafE family protein [Candidatus Dormibacteraeota bacterium]
MIRDALAILSGLFVGIASGILGVGGGIFLVPIMTLGFGFSQHVAQGTSLAAILPTSVVGAATHYRRRNLLVRAALVMGAAGAAGAMLGAVAALALPRDALARIFGLVLIFAAYRMWPWAKETTPE